MDIYAGQLETATYQGVGYEFNTAYGPARVVEVTRRDRDSWGEAYEGDSSQCSVTLYFVNQARYFEWVGYESSYTPDVDYEFADHYEVFPETKTITSYRRK